MVRYRRIYGQLSSAKDLNIVSDYNFKDSDDFKYDYYIEPFHGGYRFLACKKNHGGIMHRGEKMATILQAKADAVVHMMANRVGAVEPHPDFHNVKCSG